MWPGKKLCRTRVLAQGALVKERVGRSRKGAGEKAYPRTVRQMLMRRSAPQPAMRKTPTGGTAGIGEESALSIGRLGVGRVEIERRLTEDGDYDDEDG